MPFFQPFGKGGGAAHDIAFFLSTDRWESFAGGLSENDFGAEN